MDKEQQKRDVREAISEIGGNIYMKRILALMLAGMMIFGLAGCGDTLPSDIRKANDDDLCMYLRVSIDVEKIPDSTESEEEDLSQLTEEERTFFILSCFDHLYQDCGITGYLSNTDGANMDEIAPLLRSIGLEELGDIYENYFSTHEFDLEKFAAETTGDFDYLEEKYHLDGFDDAFYEYYEKADLTKILAEYGREHVLEAYI